MKYIIPLLIWLGALLTAGHEWALLHWETCLVLFSVIVLIPSCLQRLQVWEALPYYLAVAAVTTGYVFPEFSGRTVAFGLYTAFTLYFIINAFVRHWRNRSIENALRLFALGYWVVGAAWTFLWSADIRPFQFDANITSLTAAHFHVAGFVVTVLIRQLYITHSGGLQLGLSVGALAGMPLVATGIVATQLGFSPLIETVTACLFSLMVILTAYAQIKTGKTHGAFPALYWWRAAAFCLALGISLAVLYALRFWFPIDRINIPNMKVWHGTLNSVGFAFFSIVGWDTWAKR